MKYQKTITLKDGRACVLRNGAEPDGQALLELFILTHAQTDFLLSYPDEVTFTAEQEEQFLKEKTESENEIEILAELDGKLIGSAGVSAVPMAARVSNKVSLGNDPTNFILMQAMGPNVSGVIGSAVVAGVLYTLCRG